MLELHVTPKELSAIGTLESKCWAGGDWDDSAWVAGLQSVLGLSDASLASLVERKCVRLVVRYNQSEILPAKRFLQRSVCLID